MTTTPRIAIANAKAISRPRWSRAFAETAGETEGFAASVVTKTTRWLPEGMVFAGSSDADVDLKSDAGEADLGGAELDEDAMSDMGDEPDALPAFLSSDAA